MADIYCSKCGKKYDEREKYCPECKTENPLMYKKKVKTFSKIAALVIVAALLVTSLVLSIICLNRVASLEEQVKYIDSYLSQNQTANAGSTGNEVYINQIMQDDYTKHLLNDSVTPVEEEYFIYFHSESCGYCLSYGNQYVVSYWAMPTEELTEDVKQEDINYIYDQIPVYFAEPEISDSYFSKYQIESTPSIIRIKNGKVEAKGEGYEEVYNLLDEVMQRFYK